MRQRVGQTSEHHDRYSEDQKQRGYPNYHAAESRDYSSELGEGGGAESQGVTSKDDCADGGQYRNIRSEKWFHPQENRCQAQGCEQGETDDSRNPKSQKACQAGIGDFLELDDGERKQKHSCDFPLESDSRASGELLDLIFHQGIPSDVSRLHLETLRLE